jgi:hypothetical protein
MRMTRRRRRWLVGLGILVIVRAALPLGLRVLLASQASTLLNARVEVGDVDLALLRGAVAIEDVAVRPPVPPGAEPQAADGTEPPLLAWKRFAVNLSWLPLFRKTVELSSVELDGPRIALDRLASGAVNLMALVPKAEAPAAETPVAEQPGAEQPAAPVEGKPAGERSGWGVGVDRLVLRDGRVRVRDFAVADAAPVDVSLPTIVVRDVSLRPGLYGRPARAHLEVRVDEGRLRTSTRLDLREDGLAVATSLRARRLPLGRTRLYVPKVGWRDLEGALGASLVHRFATGGRHDVRGTVALDDVTVRVPGMEDPALAWKRFAVAVDPVDVIAQRAAVASVELAGASVLVRPRGGAPLPVAGGAVGGAPAAEPAPPAEPAPAAAAPSKPWRWSVASLRVTGTRVRLLGEGEEAPTDVGVDLEARDLAGDGDAVAPVKLGLTVGEGSLGVEGGLRIAQPGFGGTLALARLSLPELATLAGMLPPNVLQKGVLGAELAIAAGSSAPTPGDVRVQGRIGLAEPWVAAADPWEFAMGAAALDVGIDDLVVPGVMAAGGAGRQPGPIRVHLGAVELVKPYVKVTRTPDGIVLPPLPAAQQKPAAATEPTAARAPPGAAPSGSRRAASSSPTAP